MTDFDALYTSLITWARAALALHGVADPLVIVATPDTGDVGERPNEDHLTFRFISWDIPRGATADVRNDATLGRIIEVERGATLQVQGYGRATRGWLETLALTLDDPSVYTTLTAAGVTLMEAGGIRDVGALLDTSHEPRFARDFDASYRMCTDPVPLQEATTFVIDQILLERVRDASDPLTLTLPVIP